MSQLAEAADGREGRISWTLKAPYGAAVEADLSQDPTPAEQAALKALFYAQGCLEFAGQTLDREQFRRVCGLFGPLPPQGDEANPVLAVDKAIGGFGTKPLMWHRDLSYSEHPFWAIALHALDVNPDETATNYASGAQAYRTLPAALKARLTDGLRTLTALSPRNYTRPTEEEVSAPGWPKWVHPLVAPHPITGAPVLLICPMMTIRILELEPAESDDLLDALVAHIGAPENRVSHRWRNGDLFIWDNFAGVHARDNLEGVSRRTLQRCTVGRQSFRQAFPDWNMRDFTDKYVEKNYMGANAAY